MRILFATRDYPPQGIAGTEVFTAALASRLHDTGHEVRVICVGDWTTGRCHYNGHTEDVQHGVKITRLHMNWMRAPDPTRYLYDNPVVAGFVQQYVAEWRPDVVHVTSCDRISASVIPAAKQMALPVVVSLTDFGFVCPRVNLLRWDGSLCDGQTIAWECLQCQLAGTRVHGYLTAVMPSRAVKPVLTWISRQSLLTRQQGLRGLATDMSARKRYLANVLGQADRIMMATDFGRRVVEAIIPSVNVDLVAYGHDMKWLANYRGKTSADHLRIGFVGGLHERKGPQVLIQAFRELPPGISATLSLHGRSPDPEFGKYLRLLTGDDPRIRISGEFSDDEIADVHANMDVCVIPSLCYDFPLVAHEAMASGSVVVASDIPGLNEIVQDGVTGLLFERGNVADLREQLGRLIAEPGLMMALRRGLRSGKSIADSATEMAAVYATLMKEQERLAASRKPITVLQLMHGPDMAGAERRSLEQSAALKEHGVRTVAVITAPGSVEQQFRADGFKTYIVEMPAMADFRLGPRHWYRLVTAGWRAARRIQAIARTEGANLIQVISLVNPHGCLASRLAHVPLVWTLHEYLPGQMWFLSFLPAAFATRIIFVSQAVKLHSATSTWPKGLVIRDGINLESYQRRDASVFCNQLSVADETKLVGLVGSIYPDKGQEFFISAARLVCDRLSNQDIRFLIIGGYSSYFAEYVAGLKRQIERLRLERVVQFVPFQSDIVPVMSSLDALVLCSRREALPGVLIDGMACGTPVVAFDVGGVPEIVEHSVNGLLVKTGDVEALAQGIVKVLTDESLKSRLVTTGYERARSFSWERPAATLAALYRSLIAQKASDAA